VLTAYVGMGCIARPEPVISAFVLVQDALGPVELIFDSHGPQDRQPCEGSQHRSRALSVTYNALLQKRTTSTNLSKVCR